MIDSGLGDLRITNRSIDQLRNLFTCPEFNPLAADNLTCNIPITVQQTYNNADEYRFMH